MKHPTPTLLKGAHPMGLPMVKGKKTNRQKFDKMLDEYYELHKWDKNGKPPGKRLNELCLDREPFHML